MKIIEAAFINRGWSHEGARFIFDRAEDPRMIPHVRHILGLSHSIKSRISISNAVRKKVLQKSGHQCKHCGIKDDLTIDHIIPVIKGGTDKEENLQILCRPCNSRKGCR